LRDNGRVHPDVPLLPHALDAKMLFNEKGSQPAAGSCGAALRLQGRGGSMQL
jgi:hypothetical protein